MSKLINDLSVESLYNEAAGYICDYLVEASDNSDNFGMTALTDINKIKKDATKMVIAVTAIIILVKIVTEAAKKSANKSEENMASQANKAKTKDALNIDAVDQLLDALQEVKTNAEMIASESKKDEAEMKKKLRERSQLIDKMGMNDDPSSKKKIKEIESELNSRKKAYDAAYKKTRDQFDSLKAKSKVHIATYGTDAQYEKFKAITL